MKNNKNKSVIFALLLAITLSFVNCSNEETIETKKVSFYSIKTISNNFKRKSNSPKFKFDLYKEKENDNFVKGTIDFKGVGDVNVKMTLSEGHLNYTEINKINDNLIELKNLNGRNYKVTIKNINKNNAILTFEVENDKFDVVVSGKIDPDDFINLNNTKSGTAAKQMFVCGGLCIGAVVTIVGGGYCAWRATNASNNCTSAYTEAVKAGGNCSMEFESGWCGGDCNINCK